MEWWARAEVAQTKLRFLGASLRQHVSYPSRADLATARADTEQAREKTVELHAELARARNRIVELKQQVRTARRPLFGHHRSAG